MVSQEVVEEEVANGDQRETMAFLFGSETDVGAAHREGITNGREEKDRQTDKHSEAGQSLRRFDLGPDQLKTKASPLGIPDLFFDGHAAVIEGSQGAEGILSIGG